MPTRTARTAWSGTLEQGAGQVELTSSGVGTYDVSYLRYWVDESKGQIFCLVEAPDAEAANTVHREAHGLVADKISQVQEGA